MLRSFGGSIFATIAAGMTLKLCVSFADMLRKKINIHANPQPSFNGKSYSPCLIFGGCKTFIFPWVLGSKGCYRDVAIHQTL